MKKPIPVRVMTVDREEITTRPLTWGERIAYRLAYVAGSAAGWIHEFLSKLRISS
jgi:hypothetical protein